MPHITHTTREGPGQRKKGREVFTASPKHTLSLPSSLSALFCLSSSSPPAFFCVLSSLLFHAVALFR